MHQRIRHYRNLSKMPEVLSYYFRRYHFTRVADYLGVSTALPPEAERRRRLLPVSLDAPPTQTPAPRLHGPRTPVTIVVPCYNEELILPYLGNTLERVEEELSDRYSVDFLFVDDRSTDGTWDALHKVFGGRSNCYFHRHDVNKGVAAGIMTGLENARTEIVCSIDADCTYDPHELGRMIPLLTDDVDMVTASPYHPDGRVLNVPRWRLSLSRTLSALYRRVLYQKMYTYTSCFRVYRRSVIRGVRLTRAGFLGVAEMIGMVDLSGSRIIEFPTTLEVRVLGRSKMKILKTIVGQLALLLSLFRHRIAGGIALKRAFTGPAADAGPAQAASVGPGGQAGTTGGGAGDAQEKAAERR